MKKFLSAFLSLLLTAPILAAEVGSYPNASALGGTERLLSDQGGVTVDVTPAQLNTYVESHSTGLGGDCTLNSSFQIVCTKTNGVAFAASATTDTTNASNIGSGALPAGRLPALTGDATSSAGSAATTVVEIHPNVTAITNASSPYTVLSTDSMVTCDATAGAVVISLPAATGTHREISFKKVDSSVNACTPTAAGSDTIDGAASYSLTTQYAASKVQDSTSATWIRTHVNQMGGDVTGLSTSATVAKVNGNTPGGTCTNQATTAIDSSGRPTCTTLTSSYVDSSVATVAGANVFTANQKVSDAEPRILLNETDQGTDQKLWDIDLNALSFTIRSRTDADGTGRGIFNASRGTGVAITGISVGNSTDNPTFTFNGTGLVTVTGSLTANSTLTANRVVVQGSTVPTNGIYLPSANTVGFATNTTARGSIDANGALSWNAAILSGGTKFTASGCSNSATVGGAIAGQFTSGTSGTCTVAITLPTAPNGWRCSASDITTATNLAQSATSTTGCTVTGATTSGDIVVFSAMGF